MKELSLIWKRLLGRLKHRLLKFFEYLCTLNTLPTRVQSLDRINWEIKSPLAQRSGAKKPRESRNAPLYPQSSSIILQERGCINFFVYFVQDCACVVVNPCVSRINLRPSHPCYCSNYILQNGNMHTEQDTSS